MNEFREIEGVFYNDPPIPEEVMRTIAILSRSKSGDLWDRHVSRIGRHFMLLGDSEWPAKITSCSLPFYRWFEDWNANRFEEFTKKLQTQVRAEADAEVLVFWMREHAIRTIWSSFSSHWINFLYEDEGVIVLLPTQVKALVLSNGQAWSGAREPLEAEQDAAGNPLPDM